MLNGATATFIIDFGAGCQAELCSDDRRPPELAQAYAASAVRIFFMALASI